MCARAHGAHTAIMSAANSLASRNERTESGQRSEAAGSERASEWAAYEIKH